MVIKHKQNFLLASISYQVSLPFWSCHRTNFHPGSYIFPGFLAILILSSSKNFLLASISSQASLPLVSCYETKTKIPPGFYIFLHFPCPRATRTSIPGKRKGPGRIWPVFNWRWNISNFISDFVFQSVLFCMPTRRNRFRFRFKVKGTWLYYYITFVLFT